jgi:hypothetical protein
VCGRAPTGMFCAQSNGASGFVGWTQWSPAFNDTDGWKGLLAYWATIQFPDISGDGKADICARASGGIYCSLSTGSGAFTTPTYWSNGYSNANGWDASPSYWATIQFPDISGDGRADVCGRAGNGLYCAVSTGSNGFGPSTFWSTNFADAGQWHTHQSYWGTLQFPDITGDGKADVCARGEAGIYCGVSDGTAAFSGPVLWQSEYSDTSGWNGMPSYLATIRFPDVNGDGRADLCGRAGDGIYCAISNGTNGFGPAARWSAEFANAAWGTAQASWGTIQFPDVNGDGKADVCGRGAGGVVCGLSSGTAGFSAPSLWAAQFSDAAGFNGDATLWGTIQFPDLNSDGKADICGRTATGMICGLSNGTSGFAVAAWLDQYTDTNGWKTDLSYGASIQTPSLNVQGCQAVTRRSTAVEPLSRRLAPF